MIEDKDISVEAPEFGVRVQTDEVQEFVQCVAAKNNETDELYLDPL